MSPIVKTTRDLREIERLYEALLVQAINRAADKIMPGGEAMVALAGVASPSEYDEKIEYAEHWHYATCPRLDHTRCRFAEHVADEDSEAPLQTLLYWSEGWRARDGYALDRDPSIRSEAAYLRAKLDWAWENESRWDDFRKDVARVRNRIENLVMAGERPERGAPCLYDGATIIRRLIPKRGADGQKVWDFSDWHCPRCKRSWDEDAYARHVTAANEAAKFEVIAGETWCSLDYAARKVGRPESTLRVWLHRGQLATACVIAGRRLRFVCLDEVIARDMQARKGTRRREDAA